MLWIINVGDLLAFLLYVNTLVEPVRKLINFTEQFQNGMSGFSRFYEILEIEPDIVDRAEAVSLKEVKEI